MDRDSLVAAMILALTLSFGLSSFAVAAIESSSNTDIVGTGIERGIVRVICERQGSERAARVRAVILDVGSGALKREVLLAPAHALPEDVERITRDCRVSVGQGSPERIAEYWLPQIRSDGTSADWVVLMSRSKFHGSVGRLRVGQVSQSLLEQLIIEEKPIGVMLLTEAADQHNCQLMELLQRRVFSHSCAAWPGLSGSPIVVSLDGKPVVIGIQLASKIRPTTQHRGPLFSGVGMAIDNTVASAIRQAAARALH